MNISKVMETVNLHSCDVGSLPCKNETVKLIEGANLSVEDLSGDSERLFEQAIVDSLLDKLKAGIMIPAFPQFRDINEMFISTFEGLEKTKGGYVETGRLTLKPECGRLPEVAAIRKNAERIRAQTTKPFQLRICITGPYTLASFFPYRNSESYKHLGQVLSEIVEKNIFSVKQGQVSLVSIDEPFFGLIDDPSIDRATESRETLLAAWESMASKAKQKNVESSIHLHCTSNPLFWSVKSLGILESHVSDSMFETKTTGQMLEKEDKRLKASVAVTDFDQLIRMKLSSEASDDAVAEAWRNISRGALKPESFIENVQVMKKRLARIVSLFGVERVVLAGPECGLRGFPSYASAIECLRRVSKTAASTRAFE